MKRKVVLCALCLVVAGSTTAIETTQTQVATPALTTTPSESTERLGAKEWGLSLDDYRRAQSLLRGFTGNVADPRITPIEVLGINARSDAERQRYAEQFARLMFAYAERALQFEMAYQHVALRQFGAAPVISPAPEAAQRPSLQQVLARTPGFSARTGAQQTTTAAQLNMSVIPTVGKGDRLIVFTAARCADCPNAVARAAELTQQGVVVDLYVVGAKGDAEVTRYARAAGIDPQLVNRGALTLNRDAGVMARVLPKVTSLPQVVRKRGTALTQLSLSEL